MKCLELFDRPVDLLIQALQPTRDGLFVFQHVPKTAGTSIHHLLQQLPNNFHWLGDDTEQHSWNAFLQRHYSAPLSVLRGHFKSEHLDDLDRRGLPYQAVTFVRCPIQQTVSHFRYCHSEGCPNHSYFRETYPDILSFIKLYLKSNFSVEYMVGPCGSSEEALEKINDRFSFVGMTEYYNASMYLLLSSLGLDFQVKPRANVTKHGESVEELLNDEVLEYLHREYAIDIAVFEYFASRYGQIAERVVEHMFSIRGAQTDSRAA